MTEAVGTGPSPYLDAKERKALLGIARRALEGYIGAGKMPRTIQRRAHHMMASTKTNWNSGATTFCIR